MRRLAVGFVASVVCWGMVSVVAATAARADDEAWKQFKGQMIVSDTLLAPSFGSEQVMITSLTRFRRSSVDEVAGFWRLHMIAFLARPSEGETLIVAARDVTTADDRRDVRRGSAKAIRAFEVTAQPAQKLLQLSNLVVSESMGFERGHTYELTVEKNPEDGGKQDVYARAVVTLR